MSNVNIKTVKIAFTGMLAAIIVLFTCLPLNISGLEMTLCMLPIAIGAVVIGPTTGAILGGFYGICSFMQCFGLFAPSPFGQTLLSINPLFTAITCIVPRVLCGFIAGLVFKALSNIDKTKFLSYAAGCLVCPLLNTVFFMTSLMVLFGSTDLIQGFMKTLGIFNPFLFVLAFVGIQGLVEAIINFVLATAISKALASQKYFSTETPYEIVDGMPIRKRKIGLCIFLSVITFGIYYIYWEYMLVKNVRAIKKDTSGCTVEMLCLIFVPFYNIYWYFTRGKVLKDKFEEFGYSVIGNEIAYLILGIYGLNIISASIMQNDFNSMSSKSAKTKG